MEVTFLGGAKEVGKSAILVKGKKNQVLLDYGANTGKTPSFPMHVKPKEVHSVLLSHAHLDHSGGVPLFFLRDGVKLLTTGLSLESLNFAVTGFYQTFRILSPVRIP